MRMVSLAALGALLLTGPAPTAVAKVFDSVPESIKTLAVAAYARRHCPSLAVDGAVEDAWLRFVGHAGGEASLSEHQIRAVEMQIGAYERDSTMTCAAIYFAYGPMGAVVKGMVDRAFCLDGMIDLY